MDEQYQVNLHDLRAALERAGEAKARHMERRGVQFLAPGNESAASPVGVIVADLAVYLLDQVLRDAKHPAQLADDLSKYVSDEQALEHMNDAVDAVINKDRRLDK